MPQRARPRVTIDLKGLGDRLHAFAETRAITCSSVVRAAVLAMLEDEGGAAETVRPARSGPPTKVMLRIPASHAAMLTQRSRAAGVSLGDYVAGLLERLPAPPVPPDHRSMVKALHASTDRIAMLAGELRMILREQDTAQDAGPPEALQPVVRLTLEVRQHLVLASQVLGDLRPLRNLPSSAPSPAPSPAPAPTPGASMEAS